MLIAVHSVTRAACALGAASAALSAAIAIGIGYRMGNHPFGTIGVDHTRLVAVASELRRPVIPASAHAPAAPPARASGPAGGAGPESVRAAGPAAAPAVLLSPPAPG